jgi:hypothetical protein
MTTTRSSIGWSAEIVADRLAAAAATLAGSRSTQHGPAALRGMWPQVLQDKRTAYGYTATEAPRVLPAAAALTAMDAVLGWMSRYLSVDACRAAGLPSDAGWVAWARAQGQALEKISGQRGRSWKGRRAPGGNSREAVRQIARRACEHVAAALARDRVPLHVGDAAGPAEAPPVATGRHETMPRQMDTRRWVMNRRPCGECRHLRTAPDATTTCGLRGGGVAPAQRAQHPEGEPCFQAKPA